MKRFLQFVFVFVSLSICAFAQTVSFNASQIHVGGSLLASGQLCITPVDTSNRPLTAAALGASIGSSGALTFQSSCAAVTNGVLASGFTAPDTALATPKNLCLRVTITDASQNGRQVYMAPCVQPASAGQTSWCTTSSGATTCNFDLYAPTLAAVAPVTSPSLSIGTVTTGNSESSAAASVTGTAPNYKLNLTIPAGAPGPNCASTSPAGECDLQDVKATTVAAGTAVLGSQPVNTVAWGDSLTQGTSSAVPYPYQLQFLLGAGVVNGGVGGDTSSQVLARFQASASAGQYASLIWVGRNDIDDGGVCTGSQTACLNTIKANISAMVAASPRGYVVLGVTNNAYEPSGNASYNAIVALNNSLASIYGSRFVDVRALLVAAYNPNNSQDVIDHANDCLPYSLRAFGDATHLNTAGYAIVAQAVAAKLSGSPTSITPTTLTSETQGLPSANGLYPVGLPQSDMAPLGGEMTSGLGWTATGWTGSYSAGFTHTAGNTNALSYPVAVQVPGYVGQSAGYATGLYQVSFDITAGSAGSFTATLGGATLQVSTSNAYSAFGWCTSCDSNVIQSYASGMLVSSTAGLVITPSSDFDGTIKSISVRPVTMAIPNAVWQDSTRSDSVHFRAPLGNLDSVWLGYRAGLYNTLGAQNVGIGYWSQRFNITGSLNTALGSLSMMSNTNGSFNTALGQAALLLNKEGNYNVAIGNQALYNNQGSANTAIGGFQTLAANTTGNYNLALGSSAMQANTTGSNNTAAGVGALYYNTTASGNSAFGAGAATSNTTGIVDAFGHFAAYHNTTGSIAAFGNSAGQANTTGTQNLATGAATLQNNTTGAQNTAAGWGALNQNMTGSNNTAVGSAALYTTTGSNNTAVGQYALHDQTSGENNVALGIGAGVTATPANANTTGTQNTWVGTESGPGTTTQLNNATAIGYGATNSASNQVQLGNSAVTAGVIGTKDVYNTPLVYNYLGAKVSNPKIVADAVQLDGSGYATVALTGAAVFSSLPLCSFTDSSAVQAASMAPGSASGSGFVIHGTAGDWIHYICIGPQ